MQKDPNSKGREIQSLLWILYLNIKFTGGEIRHGHTENIFIDFDY